MMISFLLRELCILAVFSLLAESCSIQSTKKYVSQGSRVDMPVTVQLPGNDQLAAYRVKLASESNSLISVTYYGSTVLGSSFGKITFTGDFSTGDLSYTIQGMNETFIGDHEVRRSDPAALLQCTTLYILGKPTTPVLSSNINPSVGGTVTITCTSVSTTVPSDHGLSMSYNWTVDGATNPSDSRYTYSTSGHTLTRSDVTKEDSSKVFRCTATEVVTGGLTSDTSSTYFINVLYGPDTATLNASAVSYTENEGTTLSNIQCSADCNPSCTYRWTKQGHITVVSSTGLFSLGSLQRSEAGTYMCTATNPQKAGTQTAQVVVIVRYGPNTVTLNPSTVSYAKIEGTSVSDIQCSADCNPSCTYRWTKQGQTTVVNTTGTLSLGSLQRSKAGTYMCTATNPQNAGTQTAQVGIIVRFGPDTVTVNPSTVSYAENEGTTLSNIQCSADCYPSCTYRWTKQGQTTVVSPTGTLSLGSLDRSEAGTYICTATNPQKAGTQTTKAVIIVRYAPYVNTSWSSSNLLEKTSVQLRCDATGVPDTYNYTAITQTSRGTSVPYKRPPVSNTPVHSSLQFSDLQLHDTGTYTCHVNNGVMDLDGQLDQTATVILKVKVSPKVLTDKDKYAGVIHGTAFVNIPFYSYPRITSVTFTQQNSVKIETDVKYKVSHMTGNVTALFYGTPVILDGMIAQLQIHDLREEDFTSYTLELTNDINTTVYTFDLASEDKPLPPKVFRYTGSKDNIPSFYWEKDFNGGHEQYFSIETTVVKTNNWKEQKRINEFDNEYVQPNGSYMTKITGLDPGSYSARILAGNILGVTAAVDNLTTLFEVEEEEQKESEISSNTKTNTTAELVGTFVGAVAFAVIIIAAIFIVRRQIKLGKFTCLNVSNTNGQQVEDTSKDQHVYYNMSSTGQTTADVNLTESDSDTDAATYETTMSSNPSEHLYTDLKASPQGASKPHTNKELYENL